MNRIFILIILVSFVRCSKDNSLTTNSYSFFNGSIGVWDSSTILSLDNEIVTVGANSENGTLKMLILATDEFGNELFSNLFNYENSRALGIDQDSSKNYYVCGFVQNLSEGNMKTLTASKLNKKGLEIWSRTYFNESSVTGYHADVINSNEILLTSYSESNIRLLKIDSLGNPLDSLTFEHKYQGPSSILVLPNQQIVVTTSEYYRSILLCFDKDFNLLWESQKLPTGTQPRSTIRTMDGNLLTCGNILFSTEDSININKQSGFLLKSTISGDQIWLKSVGDSIREARPLSIKEKENGSFVMTGFSRVIEKDTVYEDHFILYTNENGIELNTNYFNEDSPGRGANIVSLKNQRNIITGNTNSDIYIQNVDNFGN